MSGSVFIENDLKFRHPFCLILAGPSSSGKSTWLLKLLKFHKQMISPEPNSIIYAYGSYHEHIPAMERSGILTHCGIPTMEMLTNASKPLLLVLDDLMLDAKSDFLADLFTRKSHHMEISVVMISQSLFDKNLKVPRNNSQYIVLMRAPSSALSIRNLGVQLFPGQLEYFLDSYRKATDQLYGYILLDMHASSNSSLRLRTNIFPGEEHTIFLP